MSENQCGMETLISNSTEVTDPQLSENQCGMETVRIRWGFLAFPLVEREPMWDGNIFMALSQSRKRRVEREPMWDGNLVYNRVTRFFPVEREPMWDGNAQCRYL